SRAIVPPPLSSPSLALPDALPVFRPGHDHPWSAPAADEQPRTRVSPRRAPDTEDRLPRLLLRDQEHESHDRKSGPQDREQTSRKPCDDASSAVLFGGRRPAMVVGDADVVPHLIPRGRDGPRLAQEEPAHQT